MVKKIFLFCLIPLILSLVSCNFFLASIFPDYMSQIVASVDLSSCIDSFIRDRKNEWHCNLYVLKNSLDEEYIFLLVGINQSPERKVIVLDSSLTVVQMYRSDQLGDLHMVDANNNFLIGDILFDNTGSVLPDSPGIDPYKRGFSDGLYNYLIWIDGWTPDQLQYEVYDSSWTSTSWIWTVNFNAGTGAGNCHLEKLVYDETRTGEEVALFFHEYETDSNEIVFLPAAEFPAGSITGPIFDSYPKIKIEHVNSDRIHYTRKGIFVRDYDDRTEIIGFDGTVKDSFYMNYRQDTAESYDIEGDYLYFFGKDDRRIYKLHSGWGK